MNDGFIIPASFWQTVGDDEMMLLFENNGVLNHGQCIRLFEHLGRKDTPPQSITVMFKTEDVLRVFSSRKRAP